MTLGRRLSRWNSTSSHQALVRLMRNVARWLHISVAGRYSCSSLFSSCHTGRLGLMPHTGKSYLTSYTSKWCLTPQQVSGRILWTRTGRNKKLLPSMSLPVMEEIAGVNMASLGRYLHSTKKRARWAEGFRGELNSHVLTWRGLGSVRMYFARESPCDENKQPYHTRPVAAWINKDHAFRQTPWRKGQVCYWCIIKDSWKKTPQP